MCKNHNKKCSSVLEEHFFLSTKIKEQTRKLVAGCTCNICLSSLVTNIVEEI